MLSYFGQAILDSTDGLKSIYVNSLEPQLCSCVPTYRQNGVYLELAN